MRPLLLLVIFLVCAALADFLVRHVIALWLP